VRLLANENIPGPVVAGLRRLGHDVLWARELMRGAPDQDVLARARTERRTLLTYDKGFGALAFDEGLPLECGIILGRLRGDDPGVDNERILQALAGAPDWAGQFVVIEDDRIRARPLPGADGRGAPTTDSPR